MALSRAHTYLRQGPAVAFNSDNRPSATVISQSQSIKFIISVAHCRLISQLTVAYKFKNTSAMLNVNTTKITIVDETKECLSRQMMLTYSVW